MAEWLKQYVWGEWPNGINSFSQVTEIKCDPVRLDSGWVTSEA